VADTTGPGARPIAPTRWSGQWRCSARRAPACRAWGCCDAGETYQSASALGTKWAGHMLGGCAHIPHQCRQQRFRRFRRAWFGDVRRRASKCTARCAADRHRRIMQRNALLRRGNTHRAGRWVETAVPGLDRAIAAEVETFDSLKGSREWIAWRRSCRALGWLVHPSQPDERRAQVVRFRTLST